MEDRIKVLFSEYNKDSVVQDIKQLAGDASTRSYFRITSQDESYIACLDPSLKETGKSNFIIVQRLLMDNKIRIPHIYHCVEDEGFILQEDLSDSTLHSLLTKESELRYYREAIDNIIQFHRIPCDFNIDEDYVNLSFDYEKLNQEIEMTHHYYIERYLNKDLDKEIELFFQKVCKDIESKKKVLTHRDYHSKNIMLKNNMQYLIDFQDARQGLPQYDLVSLFEDCYYEVDSETKNSLKEYYWNEMKDVLEDQNNYEEFLRLYDLMAIQRVYKAMGSFTYLHFDQGKSGYLKYMDYAQSNLISIIKKVDNKIAKMMDNLCK